MSTLFFKVSWQHNIDKFRDLQKQAKRQGRSLKVKNGGTRTVTCFLFYLSRPNNPDSPLCFSNLDDVSVALAAGGAK